MMGMNWPTMAGHGVIIILCLLILKQQGFKFDIRIWRNGKHKKGDE